MIEVDALRRRLPGVLTFFILFIKTRKIKQRRPLDCRFFQSTLILRYIGRHGRRSRRHDQCTRNRRGLYRYVASFRRRIFATGQISDADSLFRTQAEQDENASQTSYALVNGFWISILGSRNCYRTFAGDRSFTAP